MSKNLDVTNYRNGDPIPQVSDRVKWEELKTGAWCYYDNDEENNKIFGKLYNWYAINDPRGLAPYGWKIPNDKDWDILINFLGGREFAGGKLKSEGTISDSDDGIWESPNYGANNESKFSAFPGGFRGLTGEFEHIDYSGIWWSATAKDSNKASLLYLTHNGKDIVCSKQDRGLGISVRCLKK